MRRSLAPSRHSITPSAALNGIGPSHAGAGAAAEQINRAIDDPALEWRLR